MFGFTWQEILGAVSALICLVTNGMYIASIFRGQTKPHLFTWLVWAILPTIGFSVQVFKGETTGAWALASSALMSAIISLLALRYGAKNFARSDKIALTCSLGAIIPWLLSKDPTLSVILISIIDAVAIYPTVRKSWAKPFDENLSAFAIGAIAIIMSILALKEYSLTTALFPSTIAICNIGLVLFCLWRRRVLGNVRTTA